MTDQDSQRKSVIHSPGQGASQTRRTDTEEIAESEFVSGLSQVQQKVERWVRPEIKSLCAYQVADASGMVKLDAMENPYGLPPKVGENVLSLLSAVEVNRYPDPEANKVKTALRQCYGLDERTAIMFGNGSDEIIQILAQVLGGPGRTILSVEPGFVMYKMISVFTGSHYVGVPLTTEFEIDTAATLAAITEYQPALIFIAQPNNPTGNLFADHALRAIVEATPGVVVIDEAYTAFTDADYLPWLDKYDNVLLMRTFSKIGLAGLRFGMLFGDSAWISEFNKVRLPYNINGLTQAAVLVAIQHFDELLSQTRKLRKQRAFLISRLKEFSTITVYPSEANFILVKLPHSAKQVFSGLKLRNVLVKILDGGHPLLAECLRITVGSEEENLVFLNAFGEACKTSGVIPS